MNRTTGLILTVISVVVCGIPGMLVTIAGFFITSFGLLADKAQLKLDTNLDQMSVIFSGMGGICLGLIFAAIPILIWLRNKRQKSI